MDFGSIKNVGTVAVDSIVKERERNGEFKGFTDFCERMNIESINKKCIESLIKAGTFDEFNQTRSTLLASFENIIDTINIITKKTLQGQVSIFDLGKINDKKIEEKKYNFTILKEFDEKELLSMEKEMLGIYISGHPLYKIKKSIEKISTINSLQMLRIGEENDLEEDGNPVKYIGIITSIKKKYTRRNTLMAFITVEDLYGSVEIIVFDTCYSKSQNILLNENIVLIDGRLSIREDEPAKIVASDITEFNVENSEDVDSEQQTEKNIQKNLDVINDSVLFRSSKIVRKAKMLTLNITDASEVQKDKLRGAIKFFSGDKNNTAIEVKENDKLLPCGTIYLNEEILEEFKEILENE